MLHIPEPLYLYRVSDSNTWQQRVAEIGRRTIELQHANIEQLAARESDLRGLPRYDLGGEISPASGWRTIDIAPGADVEADLRQKWPFADGSVGAFRACDFLEHLPDKQHTMREIWRCLAPGGWLLSNTPSADGRGADMDPTHVSRWNEPSFWYWTRAEQAKYIRNTDVRFQEVILQTYFPSDWHREWNISYVRAVLVALKPGYMGPGEKRI
jgi:SAM-dependent methyltransferase